LNPSIAAIIFLSSLASNSIPFVGVPYLIGIGIAVSRMSLVDAVEAVVLSALGAAIGKIVVYFFGSAFRIKMSAETKKNLETFYRLFKGSLFLAIIIFAATPLPDDLLYIPLGMSRYPLAPYFIAVFVGKIVMTGASCLYLGGISKLLEGVLYRNLALGIALSTVFAAATAFLALCIMKIDWAQVAESYQRCGARCAARCIGTQMMSVAKRITHRILPSHNR